MTTKTAALTTFVIVVLLCFSSVVMAETETQTETSGTVVSGASQYLSFRLIPTAAANASGSGDASGSGSLAPDGTSVVVHLQAEGVEHASSLALVMEVNGTAHTIANMTSNSDGEVEAEAALVLGSGTFAVALDLLDTSVPSAPYPVLVSSPTTLLLRLPQGTTSTTQYQQQTQEVRTYQGSESEDSGIRSAIQSKVISAVVDVGEYGSSAYPTDGNFSVSVGGNQKQGYLISISGTANVVGPHTLLVNLTSPQAESLFLGPVLITLDGVQVQQASSLNQVLSPQTGDPPRFLVVSASSGLQLLVSIPHFSYHTIEILPIIAGVAGELLVSLPVLAFAAAVLALVLVVVYVRRVRI